MLKFNIVQKSILGKTRAMDPESLNLDTDPDPTFQVNPDTVMDLDLIWIQDFDDHN